MEKDLAFDSTKRGRLSPFGQSLGGTGQDFAKGAVFHDRKNQGADYGKHSLRPVADRPAKFGEKVQGIL